MYYAGSRYALCRSDSMISYLVGALAAGWLLSGMPGREHLGSRLLGCLHCLRSLRFWLLLSLLGLPGGYLVLLVLALFWAGRELWERVQTKPEQRVVEAEGIGISPCE